MDFKKFLVVAALMVAGTANASSLSTILLPTDGDVNASTLSISLSFALPSGYTLYLFDNDDNGSFESATGFSLANLPTTIDFTGTTVTSTNNGGSLILSTNDYFVLGISDATNWLAQTTMQYFPNSSQVYLEFDNNTSLGVLVNDVQPVPVPAAAWLLGTGLVGLMGVARRRRS